MHQDELFPRAAERRDLGMARAAGRAERVHRGWQDDALRVLQGFALRQEGPFLIEDVRAHATGLIPDPPDGRAWGSVAQRAARAGIIRRVGYRAAHSSNLSPKVEWEVVR